MEWEASRMSDYNQKSFLGGMMLLGSDVLLQDNQYRLGLNVRNRFDGLAPIQTSVVDLSAPSGVKQEMVTFGNYIILFVAGQAYYKGYNDTGWINIPNFSMTKNVPRLWSCAVPVSLTNYVRYSVPVTITTGAGTNTVNNAQGGIILAQASATAAGNLPGLLVQDGITQPWFIYLDGNGNPQARVTQTFAEWSITFTDQNNTTVAPNGDQREYVPIGTSMAWVDGILYIASPDGLNIFRSVEGRPLDFVVNVTSQLAITAPFTQLGGGDATTTSYSVGVGGITCLRPISGTSLFVSASNSNFIVNKNMTPGAPTLFGEYTFTRNFLFEATNLSDKTVLDSLGDTKFIDLTGVRSFNAIETLNNEGRNSVFTNSIQSIFNVPVAGTNSFTSIIQSASASACILYDNYELYAMNSIIGPIIAVYDTINSCWSSFDIGQTNGVNIKMFAKIELTLQALYAIGVDDQLYQLYAGIEPATCTVRMLSVNYSVISAYTGLPIRLARPDYQVKLKRVRVILDNIVENCTLTCTPFVDNRLAKSKPSTKNITYVSPITKYTGAAQLQDINSLIYNASFAFPNCNQGWKAHSVLEWTGGTLTQYSMHLDDFQLENPLTSQS